jgi:hypothetical protein
MTERRQLRRAAEEALTDPRLRMPTLPAEPDDLRRDDLPPGFAGRPVRTTDDTSDDGYVNTYTPHSLSRPTSTQLQFRMRKTPWYRTNAAKLALVVIGLVAAVTSLVVLLWPTSSSAPVDTGTTSAPAPSPSASPTPSASLAPPAPPPVLLPPPPPPPPPSESTAAPAPQQTQQYYPRYDPPTTKKPEIGVTRAPISVAPSVSPPTDRNSSTPGDAPGRRRGCFGFC